MAYFLSLTKQGNAKARPLLEKAIELDSKYAVAYEILGWNYLLGWELGFNPNPEGRELASKMEDRAIALDDSQSGAHSAMAEIYTANRQFQDAETQAQRAIALDPNNATAYESLANLLIAQLRAPESLVAIEKAIRLNPLEADLYMWEVGYADGLLGRYKDSILALNRFLARYSEFIFAHASLAHDYSFLGDDDAAQTEAAKVENTVSLNPGSAFDYAVLAFTLNSLWKPAAALVAVNTAIRLQPRSAFELVYQRGRSYTLLGHWREAIVDIKSYETRHPDDFYAHAYLVVDYMELGQIGAARAEAADVIKLYPEFSVEIIFPTASSQAKAFGVDRFRADLRKAGLK
jgi:tetratricopeptide (TPR) repeat protein